MSKVTLAVHSSIGSLASGGVELGTEIFEFAILAYGALSIVFTIGLAAWFYQAGLIMSPQLGTYKVGVAFVNTITLVFAATSYFDLYDLLTATTLLWMRFIMFSIPIAAGVWLAFAAARLSRLNKAKRGKPDA